MVDDNLAGEYLSFLIRAGQVATLIRYPVTS
jgi:hypothetical protein